MGRCWIGSFGGSFYLLRSVISGPFDIEWALSSAWARDVGKQNGRDVSTTVGWEPLRCVRVKGASSREVWSQHQGEDDRSYALLEAVWHVSARGGPGVCAPGRRSRPRSPERRPDRDGTGTGPHLERSEARSPGAALFSRRHHH